MGLGKTRCKRDFIAFILWKITTENQYLSHYTDYAFPLPFYQL